MQRDLLKGNSILAIDVGGGTQDILLYEEGKTIENCVKLVLPSQTVIVGKSIAEATLDGKAIFLCGNLMGGGACVGAIKRHLNSGLAVYATPEAALTIKDDLKRVEELGVIITTNPPAGVKEIQMRDIDLESLQNALSYFGVSLPQKYAIAVQDHGESIGQSNREFRFQQWRKFIERGGDIRDLAFFDIPFPFTRMKSVQKEVSGAMLMDTGAAAIWGALCDPLVASKAEDGITIVNIGNQHTVGVLLKDRRVFGIFEHHTKMLNREVVLHYIEKLRSGTLTHEEVFDAKGHGAYISEEAVTVDFRSKLVVTGPNRRMLTDSGAYMAVPCGDMMLAGSFGLVAAYIEKTGGKFMPV